MVASPFDEVTLRELTSLFEEYRSTVIQRRPSRQNESQHLGARDGISNVSLKIAVPPPDFTYDFLKGFLLVPFIDFLADPKVD